MPDYSVVVPVLNSSESLNELYIKIGEAFSLSGKSFDVIFVDDSSTDNSWEVLSKLQKDNPERVTAIRLAKNFGQHNATLCGIAAATGEFIVTIDDDLQNPPGEILKLIDKMQESDADLVYGIYTKKQHSMMRNLSSTALKTSSNKVFNTKRDGSSFRLIKSALAKQLLHHQISFIYIDELFYWYTSNIAYAPVEHHKRPYQKSNYTSGSLINMFSNLVIYYTAVPLKVMVYAGFILSIFSFFIGMVFIYKKLFNNVPIGFTALIVAILFSTSIILLSLGVLGEYLSRIYIVQNKKPPYSIRTVLKS